LEDCLKDFPIIGFFMTARWLIVLAVWVIAATSGRANTLAIFRTSYGEMAVELFEDDKPITVRNFIKLTEYGAYQNSFAHRLETGSLIQGGSFIVPSSTSTNQFQLFGGVPNFGTITNEFSTGAIYSNVFGTIAMAKAFGQPDSASSSWFINLRDNSASFDNQSGGLTVFGRVIQGSNVLHHLSSRSNFFGIINYNPTFPTLPVTYDGNAAPQYNQLFFPRISILKLITIPQSDGTRLLEWNSPSTMVCRVEFSDTGIDGNWDTLHITNGNGFIQGVFDTNIFAQTRHYRIRVE